MRQKRPFWITFGPLGGLGPGTCPKCAKNGRFGPLLGFWAAWGRERARNTPKTAVLDHFWASGRPGAGNVPEIRQKQPFWTTFGLLGGLGPGTCPKYAKNSRFGPL